MTKINSFPYRAMYNRRAAFTLLEVLIATLIASLVAVCAFAALYSGNKVFGRIAADTSFDVAKSRLDLVSHFVQDATCALPLFASSAIEGTERQARIHRLFAKDCTIENLLPVKVDWISEPNIIHRIIKSTDGSILRSDSFPVDGMARFEYAIKFENMPTNAPLVWCDTSLPDSGTPVAIRCMINSQPIVSAALRIYAEEESSHGNL